MRNSIEKNLNVNVVNNGRSRAFTFDGLFAFEHLITQYRMQICIFIKFMYEHESRELAISYGDGVEIFATPFIDMIYFQF